MPVLTFKPQMAELVEAGTKRQTIRGGARFKVGDQLHLFTGLRTKACRRLVVPNNLPALWLEPAGRVRGVPANYDLSLQVPVARIVVPIEIRRTDWTIPDKTPAVRGVVDDIGIVPPGMVWVNDEIIASPSRLGRDAEERAWFAALDGFSSWADLVAWFLTPGLDSVFVGQLIRW